MLCCIYLFKRSCFLSFFLFLSIHKFRCVSDGVNDDEMKHSFCSRKPSPSVYTKGEGKQEGETDALSSALKTGMKRGSYLTKFQIWNVNLRGLIHKGLLLPPKTHRKLLLWNCVTTESLPPFQENQSWLIAKETSVSGPVGYQLCWFAKHCKKYVFIPFLNAKEFFE